MMLSWHDGFWGLSAGLILVIAGVVLALRGSIWPGKSWRWWAAGCVLPVLAAIAVLLAMAGLTWNVGREQPIVIVLDFSPSTRGSPWRNPEFVRQLVERRAGGGRHIGVEAVGVGGNGTASPRVLLQDVAPSDKAEWPARWPADVIDGFATLAPAASDAGPPFQMKGLTDNPARWFITDGLMMTDSVTHNGAPEAWTILPPSSVDVGVRDLKVKGTSGGVELLAEVRAVGLAGEANARITFFRDNEQIAAKNVVFHSADPRATLDSTRWVSMSDALSDSQRPHPHRYAAVCHLLGLGDVQQADLWPENDRAEIISPGNSDDPRVLLVGNGAPSQILGAQEFVSADRFFGDVRRWTAEGWQAIVLQDIPAETIDGRHPLSADAALALRQFVEETGGGLILLGDGHAFGPGHWGETGEASAGEILEQLSPVSSHRHGNAAQVVYLLDASASMNEAVNNNSNRASGATTRKFALLARAVEASAHWLAPEDQLSLVRFNNHADTLYSGAAGSDDDRSERIARALSAVRPEGPTAPDSALPLVTQAFSGGTNRDRRIILITDGDIPAMDNAVWANLLHSTGADLCILAPAPASPDVPLARLADSLGAHARWITTNEPQQWSALLTREFAAHVRGTVQRTSRNYTAPADGSIAAHPASTDLWTQVWPKSGAEVLVQGESLPGSTEQPAFSAWAQRGLGRVGTIAVANNGSPAYLAVYHQLLDIVTANPGDRRFQLRAARGSAGEWIVSADGAALTPDAENRFIDGQSLFAKAFSEDAPAVIPMPQTAPGHYEARITAPGGLSAVVSRKNSSGAQELIGRLNTADVQTTEWPASVPPSKAPVGLILPASLDDAATWNPTTQFAYPLTTALWIFALIATLTALLLRRST